MARPVAGKLRIMGELVAESPLHVGGHGMDVDTDLPLARNGAGQLYVPGTSLAGALREWCARALDEKTPEDQRFNNQVWGYQDQLRDDRGWASHVIVEDASLVNPDSVQFEIRDGVGIDRQWGTAAESIKYDRAVLPRGVRLQLSMIIEIAAQGDWSRTRALFAHLLQALQKADLRLGAARTRGLGRVKLEKVVIREDILNTREGILKLLKDPEGTVIPWQAFVQNTTAHPRCPRPCLEFTVDWRPLGPLMVKAGQDAIGPDMVPLFSGTDGALAPVLPGSSVKGILRTQAERIIRTLLGIPLSAEANARTRFLKHLEEVPLIESVFGARGKPDRDKEDVSLQTKHNEPLPGLGAFGVDDCYARQAVSPAQWQAIMQAADEQHLRIALDAAHLNNWTEAFHVAVDRWTGGAAESFLYTVLEPHQVEWEQMRFTLDLTRLAEGERLPAVTLLMLVMRDLSLRRLPLGFATHRGMGTVQVNWVHIHLQEADPRETALIPLQAATNLTGDIVSTLPTAFRADLNRAWQEWVNKQRRVPK